MNGSTKLHVDWKKMSELEALRKAISEAHELGHVMVANPGLTPEYRARAEKSVKNLLSVLYTRLNMIEVNQPVLPTNIKSDY